MFLIFNYSNRQIPVASAFVSSKRKTTNSLTLEKSASTFHYSIHLFFNTYTLYTLFHIMSKINPLAASLPPPGPLYTAITSAWSALGLPKPSIEHVTWVPGQSAISTNKEVVICIGTYLLIIFGGRELMR
jgi:hypothetical protein